MAAANIVFTIAAFFLAGVFAASIGWNFYFTLTAAAVVSLVFSISISRIPPAGVILIFFALLSGFFYYHFFLNLRGANTHIDFGQEIGFSGIVVSEPRKYEKVQVFELKLLPPGEGKIDVMLSRENDVRYGDLFTLRGKVEAPPSERENAITFFPDVMLEGRDRGFRVKQWLLALKESFNFQFNRFLPADSAALISGLTFGVRSDFPAAFKEAMTRSGTTHLVALSGYNISILVFAIWNVFGRWWTRRGTFILTAAFIALFVIMTGGEASIVRAGFMGFLTLLAKESGRIYSFRNAITLTAFGMVVFDPTVLVYDVGFQLSFLSLLGLVYLMPALASVSGFERKSPGFLNWRENLLTTASAQIAVLPLLLYHFREFSLLGIIANTLILGFVPYTMFLGFALAGLGFISYYLGLVVALLVNTLLVYEISVIKLFGAVQLPLRAEAGPVFILAYYALLVAFVVWRTPKEANKNARQIQ